MTRPGRTADEIVQGLGEPDLQDDIMDSQQTMGLEAEERTLTEEQQLEQIDMLEGLRAMQTADPIRWKIYRYAQEDTKYNGYLGELHTASLTQETIRKRFGGGQFKVRGFFSNGKYAAQRSIAVAGDPKLPQDEPTMNTPSPGQPLNFSEFLTTQQRLDQQRRREEDERATREEQRAERRSKENRDFILAIGAVVAPVVTALVSRSTPAAPAAQTDLAALVTALKPTSAPESPITSMKGMLEMMTMMKTIIAPEPTGGSELAEIIQAVTPIAGPALQAFANRPPAPVQVRPRVIKPNPTAVPTTASARPAPVTIEATPVSNAPPLVRAPVPGEQPTILQPSQPTETGVDLSAPSQPLTMEQQSMFAQLKPQVDALVQMAVDGQDAKAVGEMFYDTFLMAPTTTDELYSQLCDLFEDEKTIDRIALFNKGVSAHRAWFVTLQETIVTKIKQEEAQATIQNTAGASNESAG